MLDLRLVVTEPEKVKQSLKKRGSKDAIELVDKLVKADSNRKQLIQKVEALKQERNEASQKIAQLKKEKADANQILEKMKSVSQEIKSLDEELSTQQNEIKSDLMLIPNIVESSVPEGLTEDKNREERKWGDVPKFSFEPRSHYDIGETMGCLDFKKAGEVTGARFTFLKGIVAELELALIQFMVQHHRRRGYELMIPPFIVNSGALEGTGQFPKFKEDVFHLSETDYYLIPTAEVPVTNYFQNEILELKQVPQKFVAFSPCFRSEAGSYGKDTKGLKRQHQFNKVELVKFVEPANSEEELESLVADAESILQALKLPYRVVSLCGGDIGFSSQKTYDLEVWSPFAEKYLEISSCSNFGDFQARRAKIRYRDGNKKVQFLHTLNGSGLAVGRTVIAIMENYQNSKGGFDIPDALRPYLQSS